MIETRLQMARRHVAEGRKRVAAQERLLERLRDLGDASLAAQAETLLNEMRRTQAQFEARLVELERDASSC